MLSKSVMRASLATPAALVIAVLLSVQAAAAAGWGTPVEITADDLNVFDGCRSGDSAIAGIRSYDTVRVKRSNDGGASWVRPAKIARGDVSDPHLACRGRMVDAVWTNTYRARYANSHDGGRSFEAGRRLSPIREDEVVGVDVAHGPNGIVAVIWITQNSDGYPDLIVSRVRARISLDGGETFGPTRTIGPGFEGSVAIGDGVIYVAYQEEDSNALSLRRSLDGGETWKPSISIAAHTLDSLDIVAQGSEAFVGFTRGVLSDRGVVYRRTTDKGATWATAVPLGARNGYGSSDVRLNLDGDLVQAAYVRCGDKHCNHFGQIMYRQSADGVSWSNAEFVAGGEFYGRGVVGAAVFVGRPIVLYTDSSSKTDTAKSRFRTP